MNYPTWINSVLGSMRSKRIQNYQRANRSALLFLSASLCMLSAFRIFFRLIVVQLGLRGQIHSTQSSRHSHVFRLVCHLWVTLISSFRRSLHLIGLITCPATSSSPYRRSFSAYCYFITSIVFSVVTTTTTFSVFVAIPANSICLCLHRFIALRFHIHDLRGVFGFVFFLVFWSKFTLVLCEISGGFP